MLRTRLLLGALGPGAFIAALRAVGNHPIWTVALCVIGLVSVVSVLTLLQVRSGTNQQPYELSAVKDESAQVPSYLLTFVFPFLFLDPHHWQDALAYIAFAVLLAVLVVKTDLVLVQPILLVADYHLYRVETTSGFTGILLSSTRPLVGQTVGAVHLSSNALKLTVTHP